LGSADQHRRPISPLVARRVPNEDLLSSAALRRSSSSAPICPICRALAAPLQSRLSQAQPIEGVCTTYLYHIPLCTVPRHSCGTVPSLAPPLRRPAVGTSTPPPPEVPDAGLEESTAQDRVAALAVASVCAPLRFVQLLLVLGWRGGSWEPLDTRNIHNRAPIQSHGCFEENSLRRNLPLRLRTRLPVAVGRNARGGTDQRRTRGTVEDGRVCRNQAIQTAI
jgi:hypothetical protein